MTTTAVQGVLAELAALEDPRMREVNERHGCGRWHRQDD